jgi:hypothetical protein
MTKRIASRSLLLVEDHVSASRFEVVDCTLTVRRWTKLTGGADLVSPQFRVVVVGHAAHHKRETGE